MIFLSMVSRATGHPVMLYEQLGDEILTFANTFVRHHFVP